MILDGKIPPGPLHEKWDRRRAEMKLVNPANKRKYRIIVIGTGLAGSSAAASLGELGYNVDVFFFQDSPRRAHSIAAQGGINAAKNYPNDGDSIERLFNDTIKGGDFRSREANVYRLAQLSCSIIDQAVAQGVPFARDYAGYLATRSFGGAQVSRTFYARGQTGQQLLLGAYGALLRQVKLGTVTLHPRTEMLDLVVVNGEAKGVTVRDLVTGRYRILCCRCRLPLLRRVRQRLFPDHQLNRLKRKCHMAGIQARRLLREPLFHPDPPDLHPRDRRTPGQAHAHVRIAQKRRPRLGTEAEGRSTVRPKRFLRANGTTSWKENIHPSATLRRGMFRRAQPKRSATRDGVWGRADGACISISAMPSGAWAWTRSASATATSLKCTNGSLTRMPIASPCASTPRHITPWAVCGWTIIWKATCEASLWLGEANFSDHGANRLGASALMQGLADGYFILPYTIANYLAGTKPGAVTVDLPEFAQSREEVTAFTRKLLSVKGNKTPAEFHRELGKLMWNNVGMARSEASLEEALNEDPRDPSGILAERYSLAGLEQG